MSNATERRLRSMMTQEKHNFVFLHGFGGTPYEIFWTKAKELLTAKGYAIQAPQLPDTDAPNVYKQVNFALEHCQFNEKTILVSHSLGAVVGVKILEQLHRRIAAFLHIASPINSDFKDEVERPINFDWQFDFAKAKKHVGRIIII